MQKEFEKKSREETENTEDILEKLQKQKKTQKIKRGISITIILIIIGIIIFLAISYLSYKYWKSPEVQLKLGAEIEKVSLSENGKIAYIKLKAGSNLYNITKVKFSFLDETGNEHFYETEQGISEIEVPYERSFWDIILGIFGKAPEYQGTYNYEINSNEIGLDSFENINEVSVLFEYQTETGDVIETPKLDTERTTTKTTTGGGGGGGGGTTDTGCTSTNPQASYACYNNDIYWYDNCGNKENLKENCSESCVNGNCIEIKNCTSNENCTNMNDACAYGICNLTINSCQQIFNSSTNICRASIGECDIAEKCTGFSGNCPINVYKPQGTSCSLGTGTCQGGQCISNFCLNITQCFDYTDEENCTSDVCSVGNCEWNVSVCEEVQTEIKVEPGTTVQLGEEVFLDGSGVVIEGAKLFSNGMVNGSYEWDFGDDFGVKKPHGGTAVVHRYMRPGTYPVTLTITDVNGINKTVTTTITVEGEYPKLPPRPAVKPILELKFENNLNDTSGNNLHGSWVGETGGFVDGIEGKALNLNGSYVKILDNDLLEGMSGLTISFWARHHTANVSGFIIIKGSCYYFDFYAGGTKGIRSAVYTDTKSLPTVVTRAARVTDQRWDHYAIIYDGSLVHLYINGQEYTTGVGDAPLALTGSVRNKTNNLFIGANSDGTLKFDGDIDELKLYNKALTADELIIGFESWHADFNSRSKQYIYTQIPGDITKTTTNKLKVTLTGDKGHSSVVYQKNGNLQSEEIYLLDQSTLVSDNYKLTTQLLNASDVELERIEEKWIKGVDGIPEVAINENNAILVDGELFFPITPYGLNKNDIDDFADTHDCINSLSCSGWYRTDGIDWKITPQTWNDYLNSGSDYGLKAMGPTSNDAMAGPKGRNTNLSRMEEFITTNRNHSSMFIWQFGDEPECADVAAGRTAHPAVVAAWKYLVHKNDPNHPFRINVAGNAWRSPAYPTNLPTRGIYEYVYDASMFGGSRGIYNKGVFVSDVIGFDYWAIIKSCPDLINNKSEGSERVYKLAQIFDNLGTGSYQQYPIFSFVPVGNWPVSRSNCGPIQPSAEQIKMFAWLAIVHGAKGLHLFQLWNSYDQRWITMEQLKAQITSLKDVILQPAPNRIVTDDANQNGNSNASTRITLGRRIDTMIREYNNSIYIFAVRITEHDEPQIGDNITVTFNVEGVSDAVAEVFDESRTINVIGGSFTDTFAPNDVHIYKISGTTGVGTLSPFTRILNFIKSLLTTKTGNAILTGKTITENAVNETGKGNSKVPYIILFFLAVIILIIAFVIVKKKTKKRYKKKIGKGR